MNSITQNEKKGKELGRKNRGNIGDVRTGRTMFSPIKSGTDAGEKR